MQFSSLVMFGHDIQHSIFSLNGPMNASMTHQPLKCDGGMHYLHFCDTAGEWWQEQHVWFFGHHRAHVKSTLQKLFISPSCW